MGEQRDLALVGVGYWGKNLARNFHRLSSLNTICDQNPKALEKLDKLYPEVKKTLSFDDVLEDPSISKVVIAIPTKMHYEYVKKALLHGKDVFVEKAMCTNSREAYELATLSEKLNKILMVGHILQYHPCIEEIKKIVKTGVLGEIYNLEFNRLNLGSMSFEKSALIALAPHDISILLSLCKGRKLESFQSINRSHFSSEFVDQSFLHFHFEGNISAQIHVSWVHSFPERKITINGTKKTLIFDDIQEWDQKIQLIDTSISLSQNDFLFKKGETEKVKVKQEEPLLSECSHFLQCCKRRTKPRTDGFEGYKVAEILDYALKAERESASALPDFSLT